MEGDINSFYFEFHANLWSSVWWLHVWVKLKLMGTFVHLHSSVYTYVHTFIHTYIHKDIYTYIFLHDTFYFLSSFTYIHRKHTHSEARKNTQKIEEDHLKGHKSRRTHKNIKTVRKSAGGYKCRDFRVCDGGHIMLWGKKVKITRPNG